jgi:hypothetical protein
MPVTATPITSSEATPTPGVACSVQNVAAPRVTQLYGVLLPTKRRAIIATQGQEAVVQCQLLNRNGDPVDLTSCGIVDGDEENVTVKVRETINTSATVYTLAATVLAAETGTLDVELPEGVINNPAVYLLEVGVTMGDSSLTTFSNQFYLWVDRGLFGDPMNPCGGPPNLDDIRLAMRDNAPEENLLLDDFEFDLAEVCHAAVFTCRYWNESQPPIDCYFNTMTYPAKERWLSAICGQLFLVASHRFRRNHLPYQAGGISVDDQNKFTQYEATGLRILQDYREWVKQKKVQLNCMAAITSGGSSYGSVAYNLLNTGV